MNENYNIKYFIDLLLNHISLIIFFSVLSAAAGYCISRYVFPLQYTSNITLYVQSYTDIAEDTVSLNNISNSKQLVNTYIEVLKDDAVMDAIAEQLLEEFDTATLAENFSLIGDDEIASASIRRCFSISSVTDTSAIKITSLTNDPEIASFLCNAISKVAPMYMMDAVGVGSINTIRRAKTYYSPVAPNNSKNAMTGGAVGGVLIVLLILVFDYFDNTVKDSEFLKKKYRKAVIGEIQRFDERKKKGSDGNEYFILTDPELPFDIVESFKSLRTNVTFSLSTHERKIFAVSSANLGEGKSTVCANIAAAMAQSGSKVLLIDADMRKPVQHIIFGLKNQKGLSTVIGKIDPPDKCIQQSVTENLDVMTAGPIPPNPSELLASAQMTALLNELSSRYSIIILDTPPVNVVTDAVELAKDDSGIVMVVRYGVTTDDDLKNANRKIEFAQMNMLGFILNGTEHKQHKGHRYKKGYEKLYSKHSGRNSTAEKIAIRKTDTQKDKKS